MTISEKFRVKDDLTTVYTLESPIDEGDFIVWWIEDDGTRESTKYRAEAIEKHFADGTFKFVDVTHNVKPDAVNSPKHYAVFEQLEAIEVIASSMTIEQFYGYCLGNILKYRLRAGGKDDVMQELGKADKYQELFSKFKPLCQDYV